MSLKNNQINAIKEVLKNDFTSGVIQHATGTGKSVIGINIIKQFIEKYPNSNIMWLCEFKTIINELFNNELFSRELSILNDTYNLFNYSENKDKNWIDIINKSEIPFILFINRAYLVSGEKYNKLLKNIDLIIHDECHSIKNKTTQKFYNFINENTTYLIEDTCLFI